MAAWPALGRQLDSRESDGLFDDTQLNQSLRPALGPWSSSTPVSTPMEPHRPSQQASFSGNRGGQQPKHRPAPPPAARKISIGPIRPVKVPWQTHERGLAGQFSPITPTPRRPPVQQPAPNHMLQNAKVSQNLPSRLDATPVVQAYQELLKQTEAMELASAEKMEQRQLAQAAYRMGLANLSVELVQKQKELVRFETLKNEVDIFQQHLDPFVFEIRSEHERQVNSSVYRHFLRMRAIQDMGIPIYSLGDYLLEKDDRILTPRTTHSLYRRVRRRSAAHFIDTELIPRPERRRSSVVTSPSAR